MSEFWSSSLGEITGDSAEAFAKNFKQIPDGTMALARIESFANAEYQGNKYLQIDWMLTDGDFKGQKVQQKLRVFGDDRAKDSEKARYRALNMLKLVYQLFKVQPKHSGAPTDSDLKVFIGKVAGIQIRETEPNAEGKQYNWVSEVHSALGFKSETGVALEVTAQPSGSAVESAFSRNRQTAGEFDDSDIPF